MCIWNKILVGLISVASIVLFYMAARALQTETSWSSLALKYEKRIKELDTETHDLAEGTAAKPGNRQTRVELYKLLVDRGRVWPNCDPKAPKVAADGKTIEVAVAIDQPAHGIGKGLVLQAFEAAGVQDKGQYVGEFAVTGTADKQVTLVPTTLLSQREIDRLKRTKRPWILYEVMPRDDHEIFAALTDEQKKAMLPADCLKEYLKDGKPAAKDDPPEVVVNGKYVRLLLDYSVALGDERNRRMLLSDSIRAVQKDLDLLEAALVEARAQEESCKRNIASTQEAKSKMDRERDVVRVLRTKLEKSLGEVQAAIDKAAETNRAMAGQIAKFQLEAARHIDERTRTMAQSGGGRR